MDGYRIEAQKVEYPAGAFLEWRCPECGKDNYDADHEDGAVTCCVECLTEFTIQSTDMNNDGRE